MNTVIERMRGVTFGSLLVVFSLIARGEQEPQDGIHITGEATCATCGIETTEITVVASPPDIGLTPLDKLALADDGTVWLAPSAIAYRILRYLPDGSQDLRIGEQGQGPREFMRIERIEAGPDNRVYVFGNGKVNRYTQSGEFIDTHAFPPQILEFDFFPDASMIINASVPTRERAGYLFHAFAASREIVHSFGPETLGYEFEPVETRRRLAAADVRAFWAAPMNRYEIELWETSGVRRRRIVREAEWFQPWTGKFKHPEQEPPAPRLWDITKGEEGLLWVLFILPAQNFSPLPPRTIETIVEPLDSYNPAFDIYIEVLDIEAGEVVAQRRFPNTMVKGGFLRNVHVAFTDVDEDREDQIFRITRLTLVR